MPRQENLIKLQCKECERINYYTRHKIQPGTSGRKHLELKKYCKWCRKHTLHKEVKK